MGTFLPGVGQVSFGEKDLKRPAYLSHAFCILVLSPCPATHRNGRLHPSASLGVGGGPAVQVDAHLQVQCAPGHLTERRSPTVFSVPFATPDGEIVRLRASTKLSS